MTTTRKAYPSIESLETFVFEGLDGEECEDLIHAVRLHARKIGKIEDNNYMARWASGCMVGNALRWYIALPKEITYDWEELEQALAAEYPINDESRSRNQRPRTGDVRRGRIKIICADPSREGYISNTVVTSKGHTATKSEALQVEWTMPPDGGVSRLRLLNQPPIGGTAYDLLGVFFQSTTALGQGLASYGSLGVAAVSGTGTLSFAHGATGDPKADIWRVAQDGFISMHYYSGGKSHELIATIHASGAFTLFAMCPSDLAAFNTKYKTTNLSIATRLFLEPLD